MAEKEKKLTRRTFLKDSAVAATGLTVGLHAIGTSVRPVLGAGEKIRVGFIGVGNRGTELMHRFMGEPNVEVAALCDVYEPFVSRDVSKVDAGLKKELGGRIKEMGENFGNEVKRYQDFRQLLEQKDIDAVVIGTPDHWHAIQTIMACEAGKDVYVEKPMTIAPFEGPKMVEAAQSNNRVVQVGLQRRSSAAFKRLASEVQGGKIGKVTVTRAYRISNMAPHGIGKYPAKPPIAGLDWDMWLGPRGKRPYQDNIAPYKFRWWQAYSSQVANWGVHYFDFIRWVIGEEAPVSVSAHGGRYAIDDDRTIPDTMEVVFEFASGSLLTFGQYEACGGRAISEGEIEFKGTLGNIFSIHRSQGNGYIIEPSSDGQFQSQEPRMAAETVELKEGDLTVLHIRNFLDCVKSRARCNCDLETGHRSTMFAHLANIALETKSRLEWDPKKERITNNDAANKLLSYSYRKPWDELISRT
jgi:predicted dehydrogenase